MRSCTTACEEVSELKQKRSLFITVPCKSCLLRSLAGSISTCAACDSRSRVKAATKLKAQVQSILSS